MIFFRRVPWISLVILSVLFTPSFARADLWCTAYYAGYSASAMPATNIDFSTVTHVVHFSVFPNGDGSLDTHTNSIDSSATAEIVSAAHAANRQVLICVGGAGSYFPNAAGPANLTTFVSNLTNFMAQGGYDGIDVDWEPLDTGDGPLYTNLIVKLRAALDAFPTHKLLASAVPPTTTTSIIASVKNQLDQINLMTYDLSGPYEGWVTWFNSPIYDGGYTFPSVPGLLVPSIDGFVSNFIAAGIPTNKLGIGLAFYGYVWAGGNDGSNNGMRTPRESWTIPPTNFFYTLTYNEISSSNFSPSTLHYDTTAQSAWIGIDGAGTNDLFISYDDARTCQAKVSYARNRGLGGLILWEVTQDHTPGQPDPLLRAVKDALATPGATTIQLNGANANLSFASAPLGSYRVQWSTNAYGTNWTSLMTTNLSLTATGSVIQLSDPGVAGNAMRFYRVKAPQ